MICATIYRFEHKLHRILQCCILKMAINNNTFFIINVICSIKQQYEITFLLLKNSTKKEKHFLKSLHKKISQYPRCLRKA